MRDRRRKRSSDDEVLGLDALTDIVTNSVGLLIILGIFIALSSLTRTYVFELPVPAVKAKNPAIFICKQSAFVEIEQATILRGIAQTVDRPGTKIEMPMELTVDDVDLRLRSLGPDKLEWPRIAIDVLRTRAAPFGIDSVVSRVQRRGASDQWFAFFWVYPECFETYVAVRQALRQAGYEVGFSPQDEQHLPYLCTHYEDCPREPS